MNPELLEARALLAPVLVGIQPNVGQVLVDGDTRDIAPNELTFRFDSGQAIDPATLSGIRITRPGADGVVGTDDDVPVSVSREVGPLGNDVILRFGENLPDDRYRIQIFGKDDPTKGKTALRNLSGEAFDGNPSVIGNQDLSVQFTLDLGTKISAVVPQPITRNPDGSLSQALNQIELYFNDSDLDPALAGDSTYYQLTLTRDTVSNTDDTLITPTAVAYDPVAAKAVLTFADPLHALAGGAGTFRLRVGTALTALPIAPAGPILPATDPGDAFASAEDLNTLAAGSIIVKSTIDPQLFPLNFPGSPYEPGHRDPSVQPHLGIQDNIDGISTIAYNFSPSYSVNGQPTFTNLITPAQKQRAREIFEMFGGLLGVDFVETGSEGFTIVTGDLRSIDPTTETGVGGIVGDRAYEILPSGDINQFAGWAVLDNAENWNDEFQANPFEETRLSWFNTAMALIGGLLGIRDANDLPQLTVSNNLGPDAGGSFSNDNAFFFDNEIELIYPGDHDIVHGRFAYRPDSIDVDLYQFEIGGAANGLFSAELFAERLDDSSLLDSVLRLYREQAGKFELVAQNDDYFSEDSFLELMLEPGTYYVGVSSTGNDQYDPSQGGTGFGGTSQGRYELRLGFKPQVSDSLLDASGVAFDGDGDGVPGGEYNFWFKAAAPSGTEAAGAARTIFVDKADATPDTNNDGTPRSDVGTLVNPYNVVFSALNQNQEGVDNTGANISPQAARPGDIVRIVGNNQNLAYRLGRQFGTNAPFADGAKLDIPANVTVMMDAGTVMKFQRTGILVGSTATTIDHSRAALQVLGTPSQQVLLTSLNDGSGTGLSPARGDWGGILFAGEIDRAEGRFSNEDAAIFLNHVGQATVRFGGGIVNLGSIPTAIAPIDIRDVRPTVSFSQMVTNGVAAISATPDSFEETNFQEPRYQGTLFTSDFTRVGPNIHDNRLSANTINGLFIRVVTPAGNELKRMTVSGRWDDADIIHVLTEVLEIQGTPGGPATIEVNPAAPTLEEQFDFIARRDARLAIDPNVIVKLGGARIETGLGAQLLAEGLDGQGIVFTSIQDDRYGASGSYDTSNNQSTILAGHGDFSGIYLGPQSSGSFDHVVFAFGGGTSAVEGGSAAFNVMEIHQAQARITNSSFLNNAGGVLSGASTTREGRGRNSAAAIFIAGAQPILINNSIVNTEARDLQGLQPARGPNDIGAAISINANALNHVLTTDYGRSTGPVSKLSDNLGNQGPLIRGTQLQGNDLNGMLVRGATLTTESVWDDTDIVHALVGTIYVPNFHTYGGLRLESSATESLVVKVGGSPSAGFTSTGSALDIDDRIGGALQVVGQPGRPVIITSMSDSSVGAGTALDGSIQTRTLRTELTSDEPPPGFEINLEFSTELAGNMDVANAVRAAAQFWEDRLDDQVMVTFDVFLADLDDGILGNASGMQQTFPYDDVIRRMQDDASDNEGLLQSLPSFSDLEVTLPDGSNLMLSPTVQLTYANAKALGYTNANLTPVPSEITAGVNRDGIINIDSQFSGGGNLQSLTNVMIHEIGHALGFISNADNLQSSGDLVLTSLDLFRLQPGAGQLDFTNSPRVFDDELQHVFYAGADFFDPEEAGITIPGLTAGDIPLARGTDSADMFQASHWRDDTNEGMNGYRIGVMDPEIDPEFGPADTFTDQDQRAFDLIGYDFSDEFGFSSTPAPGDWAGILIDRLAHDRNVEIYVERESPNSNVVGTNSIPDRAEFLGGLARGERSGDENLRLGFQAIGVLNSPSDVDVYSFSATAGTEVWFDIDRSASSLDTIVELVDANGTPLARSDDSLADDEEGFLPGLTPRGLQRSLFYNQDHFTINPRDAGMRLSLPGAADVVGTYYVRVRSFGDSLDDVTGGDTAGKYELAVRTREVDEIPGSVVKYADIRYATNGIRLSGQIANSPLQGENIRITNSSVDSPQRIDNPFSSAQGAVQISGRLSSGSDVNWFEMRVDWAAVDSDVNLASLIFDIDFADGQANANTTLSIFEIDPARREPRLIFVGEKSDILDDQTQLLSGASFGTKEDAFIGPINLSEPRTYLIAVSSDANRPTEAYAQFVNANAENKNVRLQPIESITRIAEPGGTLDLVTTAALDPFTLNDMTLYVTAEDGISLSSINPFTGALLQADPNRLLSGNSGFAVNSLAMRGDGSLYALSLGTDDGNSGNLLEIDWAQREGSTQNVENLRDDEIVTYHMPDMEIEDSDDGIQFSGMTFTGNQILAVGHRGDRMAAGVEYYENIVYSLDGYDFQIDGNTTEPGTALPTDPKHGTDLMAVAPELMRGAWTDVIELGRFKNTTGTIEGITTVGGAIYGVSSGGNLYRFTPGPLDSEGTTTLVGTIAAGANLVGLTAAPAGLGLGTTMIAITSTGRLYAFNTMGQPRNVFAGPTPGTMRSFVDTMATGVTDLAFSTLDRNLWHLNPAGTAVVFAATPNGFFTGNESALQSNADYNFPGGARGSFTTQPFDLSAYGAGDEPYLYFDYTLSTENAAANGPGAERVFNGKQIVPDAFRVYVRDASGQERLMATNNSLRNSGGVNLLINDEYDLLPVANNSRNYGEVQELFDNTEQLSPDFDPDNPAPPQARQARIPLRGFAGQSGVSFRFEFSTEGTFGAGRSADIFGDTQLPVVRRADDTTDNSFAGVTVSDIIVGFTERGEAVVNARVRVLDDPDDPDDIPVNSVGITNYIAARDNQIQTGSYVLEIRPATTYSAPGAFDTNDRHFDGAISIESPPGNAIADGDTFTIADERARLVFEFDNNGTIQTAGAIPVTYTSADSRAKVAASIATAINSPAVQGSALKVLAAVSSTDRTVVHVAGEFLFIDGIPTTIGGIASDPGGGRGDTTRFRAQGQVILISNSIRDSAEYGIRVETPETSRVAAANLRVVNDQRLVPGAVIANNFIVDSGIGGIRYAGAPEADDLAVPFGRIVNNTIVGAIPVGSTAPRGIGIDVGPYASPTLMNNVLAFNATGIALDRNAANVVILGSLFHRNLSNGPLGTQAIVTASDEVVFLDPADGNFLPAPGSRAIDSSVNTLEDRPALVSVKTPLGIGLSPILAPDRDAFGQVRIDDPNVSSPPGLGSNVIKDRGALERADTIGPRAEVVVPADNGSLDTDPDLDEISTNGQTLSFFEIRLVDIDVTGNDANGVGIDDVTVTPSSVHVYRDAVPLVFGVDYDLSYDATNDTLRAIPLAGVWVPAVYRVELDNSILDLAGNALTATPGLDTKRLLIGVDRPADESQLGDWHNDALPGDVNNDGFVVAQDANILITEINLRQVSDPATGALPATASPPPFFDVDNDGFVVARDVNIVITEINNRMSAPLSSGTGTNGSRSATTAAAAGFDVGQNLSVDLALRSISSSGSAAKHVFSAADADDRQIPWTIDQIFADWA